MSPVPESEIFKSTASTRNLTSNIANKVPTVNVTVTTPALRGTLDCTLLESAAKFSSRLTEWDLSDGDRWNISTNPTVLDRGFEVNDHMELGTQAALSTTPILSRKRTILCCANPSGDTSSESAIGYWSANYGQHQVNDFETASYPRNLTLKWISGNAARQLYMGNETYEGLHGSPEPVEWPWSDVYLAHNYSEPGDGVDAGVVHNQMTVSFGVLFQDAMLVALDLKKLWPSSGSVAKTEDLSDKNFNLRRPEQGLNTGLMSYSMYQLTGGDKEKLMDPVQMTELGQRVFATFFQHFVSSNRSSSGGWAFQDVGAALPANLGPV
ncbi:uncharacterized protein A1O9_10367 [Exophiala aquamarina CBS 119918]|uniref:Uncharacterized protein n=1 Tax=Exophiala aquamarina CBS 119918 TaxID=1182545 RepID=A0A072P145_9EURO|nr:uncharacterized protein A1O9_10367 [Exophiala aquamarina CBS 119918]KEF53392.1 hypothetical protein A1O9_10367 [Exophiala aquamarina CBS 119918]